MSVRAVDPKGRRIRLGMVQINNSFSGQNYLPYSVGILEAYARKHLQDPGQFEFLLPLYKRVPVRDAVDSLEGADIVFFSVYVWNIRISLEIAGRLKEKSPEIMTVFGGPQVPDRIEEFLRTNPVVDIACHGEGEAAFLAMLENCRSGEWEKTPSISFLGSGGGLVQTPRAPRISSLDSIPSPYLDGIFDPLMKAWPEETWLVLWETNRGCPFSCAYCDWGSAVQSKVYSFDTGRLRKEVDWFSARKIEFVYCCDANFGILHRDRDIVDFFAENKKKYGYPRAFSVQNTKNSSDRTFAIQKALSDAGLNKGVTLSLQSMNPETLKSIRRDNISLKAFQELQTGFTRHGIETYTDIILGLPNETYESFVEGVSSVIESGQHNRIQFNNLTLLPNSPMGDPEYQRRYGFSVRETKIINIHGSLADTDDVPERQLLVVGTGTMPEADWVRARAFGWMTSFLHFDKVMQIPLIILHSACGVSFRELLGLFAGPAVTTPVISGIRGFFEEKAADIQKGGAEYCESKEWLNIWWPADELMLIRLCTGDKLDAFYEEAEEAFRQFLRARFLDLPADLLRQSVLLNRSLIKLPFHTGDLSLELSYNIWEVYEAALRGFLLPLEDGSYRYAIDRTGSSWSSWEDWCREVIWYGNKKGAYLYACSPVGVKEESL